MGLKMSWCQERGRGGDSAAKGGQGSTKLLLQAASQIGCCNPETSFSSSPDPQIQLFGKYQGNNTAYLPSPEHILFQKVRKEIAKGQVVKEKSQQHQEL